MSLCKYKDIFGAPGTGAHSYRIFDLAVVDVLSVAVVAFIIALIISRIKKYDLNKSLMIFFLSLFVLYLLGIVMHRLFCVRTTVDKFLFD